MIRRITLPAGAMVIGLAVFTVSAQPAAAATTKTCAAGEVITHGDFYSLLVDNNPCTASGIKVESGGTLVLGTGANLTIGSSTLASTVHVQSGTASLTMTSSTISAGGITPTTDGSISIARSSVHGDITDDNDGYWGEAGRFDLTSSTVTGRVAMELMTPDLRAKVSGDRIDGGLDLRDGDVTVEHTRIGRYADMYFTSSLEMCSVHVLGDLSVTNTRSTGAAYLGAYSDPSHACTGGVNVLVDGTLTVNYNAGPVDLAHVTVGKNLVCYQNATAPTIGDVTVGGTREGQCA